MPVVVSLLRGINVGGHHQIRMEALRELYESLGLRNPQTHGQSGNILFRTNKRNLSALSTQIAAALERTFGFRPEVVLRTTADLESVVARNPFAGRQDIEPSRFLVVFLAAVPGRDACDQLLKLETGQDECRLDGCELYAWFPNGVGRPTLQPATVEKVLKTPGTARNWNVVNKLLALARAMEAG